MHTLGCTNAGYGGLTGRLIAAVRHTSPLPTGTSCRLARDDRDAEGAQAETLNVISCNHRKGEPLRTRFDAGTTARRSKGGFRHARVYFDFPARRHVRLLGEIRTRRAAQAGHDDTADNHRGGSGRPGGDDHHHYPRALRPPHSGVALPGYISGRRSMNSVVYIVGLVVIIGAILAFLGFR